MKTKLQAVLAGEVAAVNVASLCAQLGISRQTFYKYRRRFAAEGPPGLAERSRRPHRSPKATCAELEERIVRLRKELPLDNGAQTIAYHLAREGLVVPAVATIHRVLVRRGLVVAEPAKRPRSALRRFVWPRPNDVWQIDATSWALCDGAEVWIMDALDDHSRVVVAAQVCSGPTSRAAWDALCVGAARWGLPARLLSDNGICFTSRFGMWNTDNDFERGLRALGIAQMHSAPAHPQTCGKIERFHQTLKNWLRRQPLAQTHQALQAQLDWFLAFYNHERPHRSLAGDTPAERWQASPPALPAAPSDVGPHAELRKVDATGRINWHNFYITVGRHYAGHTLVVIARDIDVAIFDRHGLVRRLTLNPDRRHQPNGRPPGRPRRPRR